MKANEYLFELDGILREVDGLERGALDEVGALDHAINRLGVVHSRRRKLQRRERLAMKIDENVREFKIENWGIKGQRSGEIKQGEEP